MEFAEGGRGIYKPVRVLFDTAVYEQGLQTCWHIGSYKSLIALMTEPLSLQQRNQLSSLVTAEDMSDLLVEESRSILRVQIWAFQLQDFDKADARPLLRMMFDVKTKMKTRDAEFEARRLLSSPETIPPQFKHYKILQGFWLPPPNTSFNMPSQQLSRMAVGVTKAVEDRVSTALSTMLCRVTSSRSIRDDVVLSTQEKVRQRYKKKVLVKRLKCFAAEVLNTIADVAAGEICELFQPTVPDSNDVDDGEEAKTSPGEDEEPGLTLTAEPSANDALDKTEDQQAPSPEPDSAVVPTPTFPVTPADVISAEQDELIITVQPVKVDEYTSESSEVKRTEMSLLRLAAENPLLLLPV